MPSYFSRPAQVVLAAMVAGSLGVAGTAVADPAGLTEETVQSLLQQRDRMLNGDADAPSHKVTALSAGEVDVTAQSSHRVLDTRAGLGHDGKVPSGQEIVFSVADAPDFRAGEQLNVSLNVTVTEAETDGFVSVHAADTPRTQASNLNYKVGDTVANHVLTRTAENGYVRLYVHGTTHVVVDVTSVHSTNTGIQAAFEPARALDTREDGGRVGAHQSVVVKPHAGMVPGAPASPAAWVINTTAVSPSTDGYLTIHPAGTERSSASNINYSVGQTIAGLSMVHSTPDEGIVIYSHGETDVVVDVVGWVDEGGSFKPIAPARAMDSRIDPHMFLYETVDPAVAGVPTGGASAVLVNITADPGLFPGYVTGFRTTGPKPNTSLLNHKADQIISNSAIIPVAEDGTIRVFQQQNGHLIVDVLGYIEGAPEPDPAPIELTDSAMGGAAFPVTDGQIAAYGAKFGPADHMLADDVCTPGDGAKKGRAYAWQDFYIATHKEDPNSAEIVLEDWMIFGDNMPGTLTSVVDPMIGATFDELVAAYPNVVTDRDSNAGDSFIVSLVDTNYSWVLFRASDRVQLFTNIHKPC